MFVGWLAAAAWIPNVWVCPFLAVTGLPCPGCGMSRACLALLAGDFEGAMRLHPRAWMVMALAGICGLAAALPEKPRKGLVRGLAYAEQRGASLLLAATMIGLWAFRLYSSGTAP